MKVVFGRLTLKSNGQEVGTYPPHHPHWVFLKPQILWLAASQNTSLRLLLWTHIQNIRGWFRQLLSVHSSLSPDSLLCRWAKLIKLYLSAPSGTGSWPIEVPKGEKKISQHIRPRAGSKTNEKMSPAFTGNYFHSTSIKRNRFDPSPLPTSFSANLLMEAMGEPGPDWSNERRATFHENVLQKPVCHSRRPPRVVKSS